MLNFELKLSDDLLQSPLNLDLSKSHFQQQQQQQKFGIIVGTFRIPLHPVSFIALTCQAFSLEEFLSLCFSYLLTVLEIFEF